MTLVSLLRQRGNDFSQPFTDAGELRSRLLEALPETAVELEQALAIATDMEALQARHRRKTEAVMQKYVDNMRTRYRDAEAMAGMLATLDDARLETLIGISEQRERLRQVLTPEQWYATFRE